jgi:hypothetical protein
MNITTNIRTIRVKRKASLNNCLGILTRAIDSKVIQRKVRKKFFNIFLNFSYFWDYNFNYEFARQYGRKLHSNVATFLEALLECVRNLWQQIERVINNIWQLSGGN